MCIASKDTFVCENLMSNPAFVNILILDGVYVQQSCHIRSQERSYGSRYFGYDESKLASYNKIIGSVYSL